MLGMRNNMKCIKCNRIEMQWTRGVRHIIDASTPRFKGLICSVCVQRLLGDDKVNKERLKWD